MKKFFQKDLQTKREIAFFEKLKKKLEDYYIAVQVSMSAIIESEYEDRSQFRTYYLDYVICTKNGEKALLVIELDDNTHNKEKRKEQDERKNYVLNDAEIPLLRVEGREYTFDDTIENEIIPLLQEIQGIEILPKKFTNENVHKATPPPIPKEIIKKIEHKKEIERIEREQKENEKSGIFWWIIKLIVKIGDFFNIDEDQKSKYKTRKERKLEKKLQKEFYIITCVGLLLVGFWLIQFLKWLF